MVALLAMMAIVGTHGAKEKDEEKEEDKGEKEEAKEAEAELVCDPCVLLILRGEIDRAGRQCREKMADEAVLKQVVVDSYSDRLENFPKVYEFLNVLPRPQQLQGFVYLLDRMDANNQTSGDEIIQLGYKLHAVETCIEGEQQEIYNAAIDALPKAIRQLFTEDYCVVTNHKLLYEYLHATDILSPEGYHPIFTWTHGDGRTQSWGWWHVEPIFELGRVRFRLRNYYYEGLYLAQLLGNAGRVDYDRRNVYALDGVPNTTKKWELIPDFSVCDNCFLIRNVDFGAPEYIYAPAEAMYDQDRRSIYTGSINVISPDNDIWEIHCASGGEEINLF